MLLVTDLDGTLLTSQKTISPRTRQALVEFHQRGGLLAACSARPVSSIVRLLQQQHADGLLAGAPDSTEVKSLRWRSNVLFIPPRYPV